MTDMVVKGYDTSSFAGFLPQDFFAEDERVLDKRYIEKL
jgi:hypothetical protein